MVHITLSGLIAEKRSWNLWYSCAGQKESCWELSADLVRLTMRRLEYTEWRITSLRAITEKDGEPYLHLHINLCDENMNIHGGHLTACRISGTCELTVTVLEGHVGRKHDEETGLNLFAFD